MCDTYEARCVICGRTVPVHIADFCVPREDVYVFCGEKGANGCPDCQSKLVSWASVNRGDHDWCLFVDHVADAWPHPRTTAFLVRLKPGGYVPYGIHCN